MTTLVGVRFAGAEALGDFYDFLEPASASLGIDACGSPLALLLVVESPTHSGAYDQPSTGNQIDGGHCLRHQYRVAQGGQEHGSSQPYAARPGCQRPQGGQRLQAGLGHQAVPNPDGIESCLLNPLRDPQYSIGVVRLLATQKKAPGRQQQPEFWLYVPHFLTDDKCSKKIGPER
jgi:hypothetical protein